METITIEDIKKWSKADIIEHLQVSIDELGKHEYDSKEYHAIRDHIDVVINIIDELLPR
ncbi:hypothetical protein [Bacillus sp. 2205SS5-2]|uniref:hypothetical protein n=1 Tax=Bacillus sp. 2205SS5-2 TaxID=3109031 RepID=UPI0030071405